MSALIEFANRLRNQIDIVTVVEAYVQLRNAGTNLKGLCPFHREKTPSFTVSPAKQIFHCFGCAEGGDVIKFVQKAERLDWMDAVRWLSDKFRIPMPELSSSRRNEGERDARERLLAINAFAQRYFAELLQETLKPNKAEIAQYVVSRGLTPQLLTTFGVGLAPDAWNNLLDSARKAKFERDEVVGAGLVIHNQNANRHYDRFRNRLIFPVCDGSGRPIAFGGRVYAKSASPEEPKYVNSPETAVYKKGEHVYALHLAKEAIVREKRALLMEGYMDVIRAHQHGFTNAVASCGTALTDEQARTLKKYCGEIAFAYDGDDAGQKAMLRGTEVLLDHEFSVKIVALPGDHDPDSFIAKEGADAFRTAVETARDFFTYFRDRAARQFDRNSVQGKVQIVEFMLPLLRKVRNAIARSTYIQQLSEFLHVEQGLIQRQLSERNPHSIERLREQMQHADGNESRIERILLKTAIEGGGAARQVILENVEPEWLQNSKARQWFTHCRSLMGDDQLCWDMLLSYCSDDSEAGFLRQLALDDSEPLPEGDHNLEHVIARLRFNHHRRHTHVLAQQITEFYHQQQEDQAFSLSREIDSHTPVRGINNQYFLNKRTAKKDSTKAV